MLMQALGPTPEAGLPVNGATGPGSPMGARPFCARSALLAVAASEPSSDGREEPNFGTFFKGATTRAFEGKSLWLQLPVVPPLRPSRYVIDSSSLPAGQNGDYRGGGRGKDVSPGFLLWERGCRCFELPFVGPLFK